MAEVGHISCSRVFIYTEREQYVLGNIIFVFNISRAKLCVLAALCGAEVEGP